MPIVGLAVTWFGYTVAYFGWQFARGVPVTYLDCLLPSRLSILQKAQTESAACKAKSGTFHPTASNPIPKGYKYAPGTIHAPKAPTA